MTYDVEANKPTWAFGNKDCMNVRNVENIKYISM